MNWKQAKSKIEANIKIGTDLNTPDSTYRFVEAINTVINSKSYGYQNERGFVVPIGESDKAKIPWSMLKTCFPSLYSADGYDGSFFRKHFSKQARNRSCHVHVVGRIFVVAGIACTDGEKYWAIDS